VAFYPRGTYIGRDADCDLTLAHAHISRRHAVVMLRGRQHEVEDLGSANGTRLNGELITAPHPLHDGDHLALADVELRFHLGDGPPRTPVAPPDEGRTRSLRQGLHEAQGFSAGTLLLAVGGSVVGTILTDALGTEQWGTLAGAALGPVVSTVFSTKHSGEKGRIRGAAIAILSAGALVITWAGFSLGDTAAGKSVLPGADHRTSTFPQITLRNSGKDDRPGATTTQTQTPSPIPSSIVELGPVQCGSVDIGSATACPDATIRYNGAGRLHITGVEVTGAHHGDFRFGQECTGKWLEPGESCRISVRFQPSGSAEREATLVVHQNLPKPDRGTRTLLTGVGVAGGEPDPHACPAGLVWRKAVSYDHACVTPAVQSQTAEDNRLADSRRDESAQPNSDTCRTGFVWRQAVPGDRVCVTPETRDQVLADNSRPTATREGR
jgi:hypothetical protein